MRVIVHQHQHNCPCCKRGWTCDEDGCWDGTEARCNDCWSKVLLGEELPEAPA